METIDFIQQTPKKSGNGKMLLAMLICCLLTAGCSATMLHYDFEGYSNGQAVGGASPGPDSIGLITILAGNEVLYSVRTANALSGRKSLALEKGTAQEGPCEPFDINCLENVILLFDPNPPPDTTEPVLLSWIGGLDNAATGTALQVLITLPGLFLDSQLRVDIYQDRLEVWDPPVIRDTFEHNFGNEHRIFIRISPEEGEYAVQIAGAGIPSPPVNAPACESESIICGTFQFAQNAQEPYVMRMQFTSNSALGATYRIDNVMSTQPRF